MAAKPNKYYNQCSFRAAFFNYTTMSFWVKTNTIVKLLFRNYVWDIASRTKTVYLTFDDGPIPEVTPWVLSELEAADAKATFFCIGDNVSINPQVFKQVCENGHAIGNHTFNHLNGWKTAVTDYLENVRQCDVTLAQNLQTDVRLFRPPYGKITLKQSKSLRKLGYKIIMWDVISFDFDQTVSRDQCLQNVLKNINSGSIIVFHDSEKAFDNLKYVLPKTLAYLKENGYTCAAIT